MIDYRTYKDKYEIEMLCHRRVGKVGFLLHMYVKDINGITKSFTTKAVTVECPFDIEKVVSKYIDIVLSVHDDYHRTRIQCELYAVTDHISRPEMYSKPTATVTNKLTEYISRQSIQRNSVEGAAYTYYSNIRRD